jgi:hypothetical protein
MAYLTQLQRVTFDGVPEHDGQSRVELWPAAQFRAVSRRHRYPGKRTTTLSAEFFRAYAQANAGGLRATRVMDDDFRFRP